PTSFSATATTEISTLPLHDALPISTTNGTTTFGVTTVGTNLTTSSDGAVSQTGTLIVNGTGSITTTADAITLTNAGNNFVGALRLAEHTTAHMTRADPVWLLLLAKE